MSAPVSILLLEDEMLDVELITSRLEEEGLPFEFTHARDRAAFENAFASGDFNLVLSDYSVPGYSGFNALRFVRQRSQILPFILLSGTLSEEQAVESLKAGATDYIIKQRLERLVPAIRRALEEAAEKQELARAAAALHESAERLRNQAALLDAARDAILLIDMGHNILFWNAAAERIFGYPAEEALGENIAFLIGANIPAGEDPFKKVLAKNEWRGELPIETKSGKRIIVESRWSLHRDLPDSPPKGILLINTDITDKKEMEAQLLRTQRMETIGELSGGIAHDLNNALAPVVMAADLLSDEIQTDSGRRMLEMVRTSGKRCADMVRQILTFSRGAGLGLELVDSCRSVEELASLARDTFPRLITIDTHCEKIPHPILANPTQFHQILLNLLVNARDAMPRGGAIIITVRNLNLLDHQSKMLPKPASGSYVSIEVADTGAGIPPEIRERIFEPFFTTKPLGKGTGLGLSTVFSIVKNHDAFLELRSEPGRGSVFQLFFPARFVIEEPTPIAPAAAEGPSAGEQLLVIEDEAGLLAIVKSTLTTLGYRVLTASDGLQAVEILEKHRNEIDLVLTDWVMPMLAGADLIHRIRAIAPEMKIIVVTGSGLLETEPLEPNLIQGILQKPYSTDSLLAAIQSALHQSQPS